MQCVVIGGQLDPYVRKEIDDCLVPESTSAEVLQQIVADILNNHGYRTTLEYPAPYTRKDGRAVAGRIDILAHRGSHTIAIEVDRRLPRTKSIAKLWEMRNFTCGQVVVLRRTTEQAAMYEDMRNHG